MRTETIDLAVEAAREFIRRADELTSEDKRFVVIGMGTKHTGALRRQSMELTRALAEMRR